MGTDNRVTKYIKDNQVVAKKSRGQNFLHNEMIIKSICDAGINGCDAILEIGPGTGALTKGLLESKKPVHCIEIDDQLIPLLNNQFGMDSHFTLHHLDFLKLDLHKFFVDYNLMDCTVNVVSNLPYYITSPILFKLFEADNLPINRLVLMMQKEVGERIMSIAGQKEYGALSVAAQFYCDISVVTKVGRHNFLPAPKVDSIVLALDFNKKYRLANEKHFINFVRGMFANKRKTILNNLSVITNDKLKATQILMHCGFDATLRSERLTLDDFYKMYCEVFKDVEN